MKVSDKTVHIILFRYSRVVILSPVFFVCENLKKLLKLVLNHKNSPGCNAQTKYMPDRVQIGCRTEDVKKTNDSHETNAAIAEKKSTKTSVIGRRERTNIAADARRASCVFVRHL